jgi:hypothetical protein
MRIFSCVLLHCYLLVRRSKPAGVCGSEFRYGEGLATDAGLELCVAMLSNSDTFCSRLLEGFWVKATANHACRRFLERLSDDNKTVCLCLKFSTEHGKDRPSGPGCPHHKRLCVPCSAATVGLLIDFQCITGEMRESHDRFEKGKHSPDRDKMRTARQIPRSKE